VQDGLTVLSIEYEIKPRRIPTLETEIVTKSISNGQRAASKSTACEYLVPESDRDWSPERVGVSLLQFGCGGSGERKCLTFNISFLAHPSSVMQIQWGK
jgi:hypothetical protein